MKIIFLGAGKRLSLLERFLEAGKLEQVDLELHSVESSDCVPIATVADIHVGPRFADPTFGEWLASLAVKVGADLVIPNMDSATVALAKARELVEASGAWAVVSDVRICEAMEDKQKAESWFVDQDLPVPGRNRWPRIIKKRYGFASRGQVVVGDEAERIAFLKNRDAADYLEQDFIDGPEYTVDAYVARDGRFVAAMSRRRLNVSDGEVVESLSECRPRILELTERLFSINGWQGPLTAQFIEGIDGPVLIEVNPRFGGGVTHSIHCGLNFPAWLLRERLGRLIPVSPSWVEGSFMTRCRRDIFI